MKQRQHHHPHKTLPARHYGKSILKVLLGAAALALAALGLFLAWGFLVGPRIEGLSPVVVDPGGSVTIKGRNFGEARGDSRVEIDGLVPTASSYLSWHADGITLRLPPGAESGLVYVVTKHGRSNAKLFMNRARLPSEPKGQSGRSGPFITSIAPEEGNIGSLLVISGNNFGASRASGSVLFAWSPEGASSGPVQEDRNQTVFVSNPEVDSGYELWSDKEIQVRVPDGASSGSVMVDTGQGRSNAMFFAVSGMPGQKRYKDRRSYSLSYSVSLTRLKASGPNQLSLWVPKPVESASQRIARVLTQEPAPLMPDYRGTALYQFKDLSSGQDVKVEQSWLVQSWAVETSVDPDRIPKTDNPPPLVATYLAADDQVPSDNPDIQALAKKIVQGEKNPWRAARLVWDWTVKNLAWTQAGPMRKPADALLLKVADSDAYALAACALLRAAGVPALPVKGYLVDPSRASVRHAWLEFYVYGLGWVPMDPVLGSGALPGNLKPAFDDRSKYFGNLDNRHLAFSRGVTVLQPLVPGSRHATPQRPLALQSFYEEASGSLESYSSFWSEVEVSGLY